MRYHVTPALCARRQLRQNVSQRGHRHRAGPRWAAWLDLSKPCYPQNLSPEICVHVEQGMLMLCAKFQP